MNAWILLAFAIVFEVVGTTSMKLSAGFTKLWPSIMLFVLYGISFTCLTFALKKLDMSIAYAIWAGVGTVLIVLIGICFFKEPMTALKLLFIVMILAGAIGLNMISRH
jgi:small multidrug resistance pump